MSVTGWTYYNHAMVPTCAPHEQPNINIMNSSIFWKPGGVYHYLHGGQITLIAGMRQNGGIQY